MSQQPTPIPLTTILAAGYNVPAVVAYDSSLDQLARELNIPVFNSINNHKTLDILSTCDLLVSVHGREIVPKTILQLTRLGGINVHPCLYKYKGSNPIGRLLADGNTKASIGIHHMTEVIDEGKVIIEEFVDVSNRNSIDEIYNILYPFYSMTLLKALKILEKSNE